MFKLLHEYTCTHMYTPESQRLLSMEVYNEIMAHKEAKEKKKIFNSHLRLKSNLIILLVIKVIIQLVVVHVVH